MSGHQPILMTARDYAIVKAARDRCLRDGDPVHRALSARLVSAAVLRGGDVPDDLVTLESRVAYRIDGGPEETRAIVQDERRRLVGLTLPLTNARALAMLGLRVGESATATTPDGGSETVTVTRLAYQPEAARRCLEEGSRISALRLVHSAGLRRCQGGKA